MGWGSSESGENSPPRNSRAGPILKERTASIERVPLQPLHDHARPPKRPILVGNPYKWGPWTNNALELPMEVIDEGHSYSQVSTAYSMSKSSDYVIKKTKSRKMRPKGVLTEEFALCEYIQEIAEIGHPLTPIEVRIKV